MKIQELCDALTARYPARLAADYDNIGLLVGDGEKEITAAVVSLDVTPEAIALAEKTGADLIVTHHPVIFGGLKTVTPGSAVWDLVTRGIAAVAMHTNLDAAEGGVNDILCETIGLCEVTGLCPVADGFSLRRGVLPASMDAASFAKALKKALGGTVSYTDGGKPICTVAVCSGAGGDFLGDALAAGADALVTADVKHHLYGEARRAGISLFDCGHFETEDLIVEPLADTVRALTGVSVATCHASGIVRI